MKAKEDIENEINKNQDLKANDCKGRLAKEIQQNWTV